MNIRNLTPSLFQKYRHKLVEFIRKNGDRRITKEALDWVRTVRPERLEEAENVVLVAVQDKKVIGMVIAINYGIEESFIVVHRHHRNHNIAKQMVQNVISQLSKIYGRIATDNIPSLKVCLDNNMVAFDLFIGPTGKPTLWLGGGDWSKADVLQISEYE